MSEPKSPDEKTAEKPTAEGNAAEEHAAEQKAADEIAAQDPLTPADDAEAPAEASPQPALEAPTDVLPDAVAADPGEERAAVTDASATATEALQETPAPEPEPVAPAAVKPKGRVLAAFAFLFALAAAAGVGYLYYELVYLSPLSAVQERNSALDSKYDDLETRLDERIQEVSQASSQAVSELAESQEARLAENEAAVVKSLNEALQAAPPSQREWKVAEAEYLMRIANHRVLMEQDSAGALDLLMAADRILADLDDFALHQVRARLADEIIALEQVRRDDLQGIYLRLEALKVQLRDLPLATPEYLEAAVDDVTDDQTVWQTMAEELKQFVRIRQIGEGEAIKPLLAPDEERYLELNLRLAVEQAQLAALRRQQAVFEQSLTSVRDWYDGYMDPGDARTQAVLSAVNELLLLELARPLPDVSGSLNELLSVTGGGS